MRMADGKLRIRNGELRIVSWRWLLWLVLFAAGCGGRQSQAELTPLPTRTPIIIIIPLPTLLGVRSELELVIQKIQGLVGSTTVGFACGRILRSLQRPTYRSYCDKAGFCCMH